MKLEDNIIIKNHMTQLDKTDLNQINSVTSVSGLIQCGQ